MYINTSNPILLKDEVGKAKPCTRRLMPTDFSYGYKPVSAPEGVKECPMIRHQPARPEHPDQTTSDQQGLRLHQ